MSVATPSNAYENIYTATCGINHALCNAGIRPLSWSSGRRQFITMKTVESSAEKPSTHLKRHLAYVATPATSRNSEYQRRVSPIVRIGGRSSESHNNATKADSTTTESPDVMRAEVRRLQSASTDATSAKIAVAMVNQGNMFQPVIIASFLPILVQRA